MWVRCVEDCDCPTHSPRKGHLYEIPDVHAKPLVEAGSCVEVEHETAMRELNEPEVESRGQQPKRRSKRQQANQSQLGSDG